MSYVGKQSIYKFHIYINSSDNSININFINKKKEEEEDRKINDYYYCYDKDFI